jgi:hypothetical protein
VKAHVTPADVRAFLKVIAAVEDEAHRRAPRSRSTGT